MVWNELKTQNKMVQILVWMWRVSAGGGRMEMCTSLLIHPVQINTACAVWRSQEIKNRETVNYTYHEENDFKSLIIFRLRDINVILHQSDQRICKAILVSEQWLICHSKSSAQPKINKRKSNTVHQDELRFHVNKETCRNHLTSLHQTLRDAPYLQF